MLRLFGVGTFATGIVLAVAALIELAVVFDAGYGAPGLAAQECATPVTAVATPPVEPPAAAPPAPVAAVEPAVAVVRMPETGTGGLLGSALRGPRLQDACPTPLPPTPTATVAAAVSPAPTAAPTLEPGSQFNPGGGGGIDIPSLPGGGY